MTGSCIQDSIDRIYVKFEMLEKTLTPLLGRDDVKGEALAALSWIEEIYDELAAMRRRVGEKCSCTKPS